MSIGLFTVALLEAQRLWRRRKQMVESKKNECLNPDYCGLGDVDTLCDNCLEKAGSNEISNTNP